MVVDEAPDFLLRHAALARRQKQRGPDRLT